MSRFEDNIEILKNLEREYRTFENEIKDLIESSKSHRYNNKSSFMDQGYLKFDFNYLLFSFGYNHQFLGNHSLAIDYYDRAYNRWRKGPIKIYREDIIKTLINIASIYGNKIQHKVAIEYLQKALELTDITDEDDIVKYKIWILEDLAIHFMHTLRLDRSLDIINRALELAKSREDEDLICSIITTSGRITKHIDPTSAIEKLITAKEVYQNTNLDISYIFDVLFQLASIHVVIGDTDNAERYYKQLLEIHHGMNYQHMQQKIEYLKLVIESNKSDTNRQLYENRLLEIFQDEKNDIEIRTLVLMYFIQKMYNNNSHLQDRDKLYTLLNDFITKYNIRSLKDYNFNNLKNVKRVKRVIRKQIPLIESSQNNYWGQA